MTIEEEKESMRVAMRDSLIQQGLALLKFGSTEAFALQVPDTDILILVGPQDRIHGYLSTPIPYGAAGAGLRGTTLKEAERACQVLHTSAQEPLDGGNADYNSGIADCILAIRALKGAK